MRISDRFIDNGVVGGFLLAGQFILLALWGLTGWIKPVADFLTVPASVQPAVNILLAALGITSIFFFGLFLDLFSTIFPSFVQEEMVILKRHIDHNQWLAETIAREDTYFKEGYDDFIDSYNHLPEGENRGLYIGFFHQLIYLTHQVMELLPRRNKSEKAPQEQKDPKVAYYKLRYFFNSYVLLNSDLPQLDTLTNPEHWWRASRAICVATVFWALEPPLVLLIWLVEAVFAQQYLPHFATVVSFILSWFVLLLLPFVTLNMTTVAFDHMCHTLFSFTHVTYVKKKSDYSSSVSSPRFTEH